MKGKQPHVIFVEMTETNRDSKTATEECGTSHVAAVADEQVCMIYI